MPLRTAPCSSGVVRAGPTVPVGPAAGQRYPAEHAALCRSCGVADGVVNQVGPSGTPRGSSELVKAHTLRRGRPSCRNTPPGGLVGAAPWSRSETGPLPLRTRRVSYGEVLEISCIQPTWESGEVMQPEASGPRRRPTEFLVRLQALLLYDRRGPAARVLPRLPSSAVYESASVRQTRENSPPVPKRRLTAAHKLLG